MSVRIKGLFLLFWAVVAALGSSSSSHMDRTSGGGFDNRINSRQRNHQIQKARDAENLRKEKAAKVKLKQNALQMYCIYLKIIYIHNIAHYFIYQ
jgi:hypothetical protein